MLKSDITKYDYIDALRGIAILGVILVHSSQTVAPTNATLLWLMGEGARGVQLFYVASAMTLCMSWFARSSHERNPIRNFYIRRFFRIAPMFYIAIFTYILLNGFSPTYWAPNGIEWWFIASTAAFIHGFHPETFNSVVPGGWSIAVEMTFYFILPILFPYIKSIKFCIYIFGVSLVLSGLNLLIVPAIFSYPENHKYLLKAFVSLNFFGQLPVFLVGILGFLIIEKNYSRKKIAIALISLFTILLLAFLYPIYKVTNNYIVDRIFAIPHNYIASMLFCVLALFLSNWPTRLLVNKLFTTLGKLSFSMYLVHFCILTFISRLNLYKVFENSNLLSFLFYLLVVIIVAALSFYCNKYIEKPGIAIGKHLIVKLEQ